MNSRENEEDDSDSGEEEQKHINLLRETNFDLNEAVDGMDEEILRSLRSDIFR